MQYLHAETCASIHAPVPVHENVNPGADAPRLIQYSRVSATPDTVNVFSNVQPPDGPDENVSSAAL
jgi:hypothetical protein